MKKRPKVITAAQLSFCKGVSIHVRVGYSLFLVSCNIKVIYVFRYFTLKVF